MDLVVKHRKMEDHDVLTRNIDLQETRSLPNLPKFLLVPNSCQAYLEATSPKDGILVGNNTGTIIVIAHSLQTGRTSVSHLLAFGANYSLHEQPFKWVTGDGRSDMQLLVIHSHLTRLESQLESKLRSVASSASISSLSYATKAVEPLVHAVEVSKHAAMTTCLHFNLGKTCNFAPLGDDDDPTGALIGRLAGLEESISVVYQQPQPLWNIYDGQRKLRLSPLSLTARDLIKTMRESTGQQAGASEINIGLGAIAGRGLVNWNGDQVQLLLGTLLGVVASPGWCSVCGNLDDLEKCSSCGWETYCCVEHQKEDWPHHRAWCKKNRMTSASTK